MGQYCGCDDRTRYTGDDKYPSNMRPEGTESHIGGGNKSKSSSKRTRAASSKYNNMNDDSSSDDGYDNDISHDEEEEESKSISSKALTDQDIEIAHDGWKKAIESGNETLATFYFEEYPKIDMFQFKWDNGDSALHIACKNKKARLVFFLLTQGASVNEQNNMNENTALHYATSNHDEKIVDLLLKWDADPNVMNKDKETPITISSQWRDQTIHRMLAGESDDIDQYLPKKTNTERFAALQVTAEMLNNDSNVDDHLDDILGIDDNDGDFATDDDFDSIDNKNKNKNKNKNNKNNDKQIQETQEDAQRRESDLALRANQVARSNPFTKFGRRPTGLARKIVKDNLKQKPLPKLEAWLEKKKPGGVVPTYQKRWIVVKGAHMLWSSKQRAIVNDADRKERKKFNGAIHLMTIEAIQGIETSANNKFMVKAKDAKKGSMREYVFRCTNKRERDFWVQGLKEHKRQYQTVLSYLGK